MRPRCVRDRPSGRCASRDGGARRERVRVRARLVGAVGHAQRLHRVLQPCPDAAWVHGVRRLAHLALHPPEDLLPAVAGGAEEPVEARLQPGDCGLPRERERGHRAQHRGDGRGEGDERVQAQAARRARGDHQFVLRVRAVAQCDRRHARAPRFVLLSGGRGCDPPDHEDAHRRQGAPKAGGNRGSREYPRADRCRTGMASETAHARPAARDELRAVLAVQTAR
mmetsp:Transcript_33686/g.77255  ORF Transcript_33686/g.77255 Transcript_33686/m.77255 type:complete len:224 (-) Transcript_33686:1004-1675(-)